MAFTKEIIDFSNLSRDEIRDRLHDLNIPLTVDEALKIQNDMLGRAPSLAELVLFSIVRQKERRRYRNFPVEPLSQ